MKTVGAELFIIALISLSMLLSGAMLAFIAWITSYPVEIPPIGEYVFDRINPLLWPSLSLAFTGLYLVSKIFKKPRSVYSFAFVLLLHIHYTFFPLLPGSDSHYFRGLTNLFSKVALNPNLHKYFQWPSFFITSNFLMLTLDLDVGVVSKLIFIVIGFVATLVLFLFYSSQKGELGFLGVALYFMSLFYFINYQYAPQSLALALFLLLISQVIKGATQSIVTLLLIFIGLILTHSFYPIYFLLFLSVLMILRNGSGNFKRSYLKLLLPLCVVAYACYVIYVAAFYFNDLIKALSSIVIAFQEEHEYAYIVRRTIQSKPVSELDAIAQAFSRGITLSLWAITSLGFMYMLLRKKVNSYNLALFMSGVIHFLISAFFNVLGGRALQVLFIPLVFGIKLFLEKYEKVVKTYLLLVFLLFPLVIIHSTYDFRLVQTVSGKRASDILLEHIRGPIRILAAPTDGYYIYGSVPMGLVDVMNPRFIELNQLLAKRHVFIIYNPPLERELLYALDLNHSQIYFLQKHFLLNYNKCWDDGYTQLLSSSQ